MAAGTALAAMKGASKFGMANNAMAIARAKEKEQQTPTDSMGGRIEGIESRLTALESSGSTSELTAAPVPPAVESQAEMAESAAQDVAQTEIPTGRFSDAARLTAKSVFGSPEQRQASVGMIPAGVAGADSQTLESITQLMQEQNI